MSTSHQSVSVNNVNHWYGAKERLGTGESGVPELRFPGSTVTRAEWPLPPKGDFTNVFNRGAQCGFQNRMYPNAVGCKKATHQY